MFFINSVPLEACSDAGRGNQMHDRTATPKPLVGALPELKGYSRDLRIDACRGIALGSAAAAGGSAHYRGRV
jgi:hypothetical protein